MRNNPDGRCTSPTKCLFLWFLHQIRMISRRTSPPYMFICSRRNAFHPSTYTTCPRATCTPRPPTLAANRCDAVSGECTKVRITECRVSTLHDEKSLIAIPTPRGRDHDRQHNRPNRPAWPPLREPRDTAQRASTDAELNLKKNNPDFRTHAPPARGVPRTDFFISHQ